ncbi:MAG: hypothetical protein KatS3mg091_437 [Patescibacteria group bacterium]|nr:MAG: hypothetical protein KatS3mg091_437 [Patescibacteria group bacterium]
MRKNPVKITALAILLGLLTATTTVIANTADSTDTLIDRLAQRFKLNRQEVQQVFDEYRQEKLAKKQKHFQTYLDQAVTDGKITEEQKQKILEKNQEMQQQIQELKNLDWQTKKERMSQIKQDYQNWLKENNIPLDVFPHKLGFYKHYKMPF